VDGELADLISRLAIENLSWGYVRIQGEMRKLGYRISRATIQRLLRQRSIPPAPQRCIRPYPGIRPLQAPPPPSVF